MGGWWLKHLVGLNYSSRHFEKRLLLSENSRNKHLLRKEVYYKKGKSDLKKVLRRLE